MMGHEVTKLFQKKFEKPLDNHQVLWYNKDVIKGRKTLRNPREKGNPMKNEIRVAAQTAVDSLLTAIPNLIPVRVGKKDGYAIDTGVKDENGKTVYAVLEATVKNTEDTKTSQAFDLDLAMQERTAHDNAPKKEAKKKEADPEAEAKRAKREEQKQALTLWLADNLTSEQMTTTDIQSACPDMEGISIMQVGTWLTAIAKEDSSIKRDVVKGKPYYSKV